MPARPDPAARQRSVANDPHAPPDVARERLVEAARELLGVDPDRYVAERTSLARAARAAGHRETATAIAALTRPPLVLWAALAAAAADPASVQGALDATGELASVQAAGADRARLAEVTRRRKEAIEAVTDVAMDRLSRSATQPDGRRLEVRAMVDRLTRLADAGPWLDGTLRDVPEVDVGFAAFAGADVAAVPTRAPRERSGAAPRPAAPPEPDVAEVAAAARQAARAELHTARQELRDAERELAGAVRTLATAERAVEDAQTALRRAVERCDDARGAHDSAAARRDASAARVRRAESALQ